MKKLIFLAVTLLVNVYSQAQSQKKDSVESPDVRWTDISIFLSDALNPDNDKPLLWFSREEGKYFLETRVNFDWRETAGLLIGKTFSRNEKFWITPKMGILFAFNPFGHNGLSPEVNLGGGIKKIKYFSMNQYAISLDKNPSFLYNYTELGFELTPWARFNYSAQFYYPLSGNPQSEVWIDQGPQLILTLKKKYYFKPWYTWDPTHKKSDASSRAPLQKWILGIGYHF